MSNLTLQRTFKIDWLTFNMKSGICSYLSKLKAINRLISDNTVFDFQRVNCSFHWNFIFVIWFKFNTIFNPQSSFHIRVREFYAEHCLLCFCHSQVLKSLLYLNSWKNIKKKLMLNTTILKKKKESWFFILKCITYVLIYIISTKAMCLEHKKSLYLYYPWQAIFLYLICLINR